MFIMKKNGATLIYNVSKCERKFPFICAYFQNCHLRMIINFIVIDVHIKKVDTENIIKKYFIKKEKNFIKICIINFLLKMILIMKILFI